MKTLCNIFLVFFSVVHLVSAQQRPYPYRESWYTGSLTTKNGDVLIGKLQFDWETNSLKIQQENTLKTYSPSNVLFFEFYDPNWRYNRQFRAYDYAFKRDYEIPIFFEVIQEGTVSVLMRENDNTSVGINVKKLSKPAFECFFGLPDNTVKRYDGKPQNFHFLLPHHEKELKQFVQIKRLDYGNLGDIMRLVAYYNSLEDVR